MRAIWWTLLLVSIAGVLGGGIVDPLLSANVTYDDGHGDDVGHGDDDGQADGGGDNGWGADGLPETMQGSLDEFVGQVCVTTRAPVMSVCACDLPFVSSWAQDATLARLQKDIETRLARVQIGEARRLQRAGHPTASPAGWYFQAGCEQQPPTLQQKALS